MGLIEFCIFAFVVILIGWLATWALGYFLPGHPAMVDKLIWGLVIVIIVIKLLQVTGIMHYDPQIPHV